ncbi:MAG: UbiH/UbiF family hydroxylase [Nevskia sp.]|nr:UbiH/UbiF family hydroxylase [Nevskia sp.]
MRHDIIVVGGGPVGAAAALALHDQGLDVALIERRAAPRAWQANDYDLRVYALAPSSQQLLADLNVWDALAAARISPYTQMKIWQRDPELSLKFSAADAGRTQLGWIVEHGLITATLWSRLQALPCHTQAEIEAAQFDDDGASLQLRDGRKLQARLIVAADGADSQMRRLAGIETLSWRYGQRAIVCHVRTEQAHRQTAWQRFLKSGPLALLPLADGRSSIVWSADDALAEELLALDDAAFCARLGAAAEQVLGAVLETTGRIGVPLQLLHAREYLAPSLVLVGDAAHAVHPLAGQGVNLGFADVQTLVATIVSARRARRDWGSARTLARYARARKAHNLEMLALTDTLYRAFRPALPGLRAALGFGMGAIDRTAPLKSWLARRAAQA